MHTNFYVLLWLTPIRIAKQRTLPPTNFLFVGFLPRTSLPENPPNCEVPLERYLKKKFTSEIYNFLMFVQFLRLLLWTTTGNSERQFWEPSTKIPYLSEWLLLVTTIYYFHHSAKWCNSYTIGRKKLDELNSKPVFVYKW